MHEEFDTHRFADYKEKVIDLLMRVTRMSGERRRSSKRRERRHVDVRRSR